MMSVFVMVFKRNDIFNGCYYTFTPNSDQWAYFHTMSTSWIHQ